jgi:hypothetical protein
MSWLESNKLNKGELLSGKEGMTRLLQLELRNPPFLPLPSTRCP